MRVLIVRKKLGSFEMEVDESFVSGTLSMYEHDPDYRGNVHENTFKRIDFTRGDYLWPDGTNLRVYFEK